MVQTSSFANGNMDSFSDATADGTGQRTPTYSIKKEFAGATVLVTGSTGYIGSLVVEQLLRTTDVRKVYLLVRGKRGLPAQDRIARLLNTGLFHMVRDKPELLAKVELAEGDMDADGLGLSEQTQEKLISQVHIVIHSAASIDLEADVQETLHCNYNGTQHLLNLSTQMKNLRCFLHVSTAYVNMNLGRGSTVDEVLYPLKIGKQQAHYQDVVDDLMSIERDAANVRAQMYMDMWGFPNSYTMGKNLTEKMVASYYQAGLPIVIVRPSLVGGLAGDPYPGYCGNLAGPVGMGVATAIGLFDKLESVAMVPTHVWDAVPGDVVSSVILAAAAATAAKVDINMYKDEIPTSRKDPVIIHAGTSTTYPISMAEGSRASVEFIANNPAPYKLPGSGIFNVPLDYKPDEAAIKRRKYWTSWKVWFAVLLLQFLGMKKVARRLKYGFMAWEVMNSTKTDVNIFFSSRNLLRLEACLDQEDEETGLFKITWTLKNGGWTRYIWTNLAGMYRHVFGIRELKGLKYNDFKFIPNKPVASTAAHSMEQAAAEQPKQGMELRRAVSIMRVREAASGLPTNEGSSDGSDMGDRNVVSSSFSAAAAAFSHTPADRSPAGLSSLDTTRTSSSGIGTSRSASAAAAALKDEDDTDSESVDSLERVTSISLGPFVGPPETESFLDLAAKAVAAEKARKASAPAGSEGNDTAVERDTGVAVAGKPSGVLPLNVLASAKSPTKSSQIGRRAVSPFAGTAE